MLLRRLWHRLFGHGFGGAVSKVPGGVLHFAGCGQCLTVTVHHDAGCPGPSYCHWHSEW